MIFNIYKGFRKADLFQGAGKQTFTSSNLKKNLASENSRLSSLLTARDSSPGGTSAQ